MPTGETEYYSRFSDADITRILNCLEEKRGVDFSAYRADIIRKRIQHKLNSLNFQDVNALIDHLKESPDALNDLIVLDLALPKIDGPTVVKTIKSDPAIRHIPIVALTSKAMKEDREEALDAGCDDYLSKPVDPEHLRETVRRWLNQ